MAGISIKEYGLTFVWACLREYLGASWPFLLIFCLGILAGILMPHLKKKKEAIKVKPVSQLPVKTMLLKDSS